MMNDNLSFLGKLIKLKENLKDLTSEEAYTLMKAILGRKISGVKIAAVLTALRIKGESPEELYGLYTGMRDFVRFSSSLPDALDLALNYDGKVKTP